MKNLPTLMFSAISALAILAAVLMVQAPGGSEPTADITQVAAVLLSGR